MQQNVGTEPAAAFTACSASGIGRLLLLLLLQLLGAQRSVVVSVRGDISLNRCETKTKT